MSSARNRLQSLVDRPCRTATYRWRFPSLAELGEQEIIDAETAARLDQALAEPGNDVPLEEVRRRLGPSA